MAARSGCGQPCSSRILKHMAKKKTWSTDTHSFRSDSGEAPAPLPGCVVHVVMGDSAGQKLELVKGMATLGRGDSCELTLEDRRISGRHLSIEVVEDGFLVSDLGSKNGTYYLGTRIQSAVVPLGATLRVGETRLLLSSRQPPRDDLYSKRSRYGALVGSAPSMRRLYATLERLEATDYTTLILGETGVGKELVAREIHRHSPRAKGPYEVVDCASLTPTLIESELFGHTRGAFTGANTSYDGAFKRAHGGTTFLDEIGELPLELQPKLLRVLESHQIRALGSGDTIDVDTRIIAATNRDLETAAEEGRFRKDLFYRLAGMTIVVPPLRERREDIPMLVQALLEDMGAKDVKLAPATLEHFMTGSAWPGNVRELRNALARFRATGATPLEFGSDTDIATEVSLPLDTNKSFQQEKKRLMDSFERDYLSRQLSQADDNISQAARASGMERTQFKRLLKKHGLI